MIIGELGPTARSPWRPSWLEVGGWTRWVGVNLATAAAYFVLGWIVSTFFAAYGLFPAPIWLPTGIAMVAAMVGEFRLLPGIFLGSFLTNHLLFAPPVQVTTVISLSNALGPVIAALAMRRLRPAAGLFTSVSGIAAFVFCMTFLGPALIALGGATALSIGKPFDITHFYGIWVSWWLCDSGGTLYLAPALILWLGLERELDAPLFEAPELDQRSLIVWGGIAAVSLLLFLTPPLEANSIRAVLPFLLVVPLSWIALRMSLRSAYALVTLVAIVATASTVAGYGPFQNTGVANPLRLVGALVVLLAMNVLTIVALVNERHEAERANKVKSMFLATTSHELRTPLNAIIGFSQLLDRQAAEAFPDKEYARYAGLISSSGQHLLALINDLLEMSKIEAGRFDLAEEPVALASAVTDVVALIEVQARAKAIDVEADLHALDIALVADPKALRQILLNLLSNAIKFTPPGGRIDILGDRLPDGALRIRIRDTGVGIPADALERVFAPFERAHRDRTRPIEGTGLGLSITRGLVLLHGGTIGLDSTVGRGTTATVTFPASRVDPVEHQAAATTMAR